VQRVYGIPDGLVVMEITNATPTPIALGFAVRPYDANGASSLERIGLRDTTVIVDGRPVVVLPKRPQRIAVSTGADGDVVHRLLADDFDTELAAELRDAAGTASATFLLPLAHRQTLRVVLSVGDRPATHQDVPDSDAVVRSWQAQTSSRGMRLVLPEGRLASAIDANRRALLLRPEPEVLDLYGFHQEAAESARDLRSQAAHRRLTGSVDGVDAAAVAKVAGRLERRRRKEGASAELVRELLDASELLRALGADVVADETDRWVS
jgi:hypothetical protein